MRRHCPEVEFGRGQREQRAIGTLSLIPGTEPYTIHATIFPPDEGKPLEMQVTGDTSGNYQALQRSFPFEAALARVKDAVCKSPATVSSLQ